MLEPRVALVWNGPISYDFGPQHPLQPVRVELAVELMRAYGLLDRPDVQLLSGRAASDDEIGLIHTRQYVETVRRAGLLSDSWMSIPEYGLGPGDNPIFPDMHEASAEIVGGSIDAAEFVMRGGERHAFSISGGLHHAMPNRASGFCVYNDAAIAIEQLRRSYGVRIAYLDTDAHHGDGVQAAFYDTDDVLTISFHESGRYLFPGTGFINETGTGKGAGYAINVPVPPGTADDALIYAFDTLVPDLLRSYKPDVIVNQNGADAHRNDPQTHLAASTIFLSHVAEQVHQLSHELCGGRWLALGGGGYDLYDAVPRAWAQVFAEMTGAVLAQDMPLRWLHFQQVKSGGASLSTRLADDPTVSRPAVMNQVCAVVDKVRQVSPLLHG